MLNLGILPIFYMGISYYVQNSFKHWNNVSLGLLANLFILFKGVVKPLLVCLFVRFSVIPKVISCEKLFGFIWCVFTEISGNFVNDFLIVFVKSEGFEQISVLWKHFWDSISNFLDLSINLVDKIGGVFDDFLVYFWVKFTDFQKVLAIEVL